MKEELEKKDITILLIGDVELYINGSEKDNRKRITKRIPSIISVSFLSILPQEQ